MTVAIHIGDCREVLRTLPDESVHCVVTSPPYWGLRDYGTATWQGGDLAHTHDVVPARNGRGGSGSPGKQTEGAFPSFLPAAICSCGAIRIDSQLGLEPDFRAYVAAMVDVFREVRRVLRKDGTLWLNLGDSYATSVNGRSAADTKAAGNDDRTFRDKPFSTVGGILKPKDICGIPWRVAFALQEDGWYLRQDIIWSKPNPMPESVTDRCTKAHEYLFLLSKSERYYYDADAIKEPGVEPDRQRNDRIGGANGHTVRHSEGAMIGASATRNKRSVWEVTTQPFSDWNETVRRERVAWNAPVDGKKHKVSSDCPVHGEQSEASQDSDCTCEWYIEKIEKTSHFATFPPALIEPCIKAGCPVGGTVLDPFAGAGTTGLVADRLQRNAILIELNPDYSTMSERRITSDAPLFADVVLP